MNYKRFFQLLAIIFMFSCANLSAHPHSWIEIKTEIKGDSTQISALKMQWKFDAMTSVYMLDGYDLSAQCFEQSMQEIATSVIENMASAHYFTYLYNLQKPVKYKIVTDAKLFKDKNELILEFEIILAKPLLIKNSAIKLLIFDPSYYVDLFWVKDSAISLSSQLASKCSFKLIEPQPTAKQVNQAMSLTIDADPDYTLGQIFTQKVQLMCDK